MAMFRDDSTDDVTCCYLQLGERLRINRGDRPYDRNAMNEKDKRKYSETPTMRRAGYDAESSSSSSLDAFNDPSVPGPSSGRVTKKEEFCAVHNKKRQNGDKPVDQFVNPKRTCLDDTFQREPTRSASRKITTNGDIPHSKKVMDFTTNPPQLSTRSLLPGNTYEEHFDTFNTSVLNGSDFSDSDFSGPSAATKKTMPPANNTLPKHSGMAPPLRSQDPCSNLFDSTSEDDSRTLQLGSLKGGRQSPDGTNKMVLRKKIKRLLDSDDSDSDVFRGQNFRRPVFFSSSDSDDSKPGRRSKTKPAVASKKSANPSSSPRDLQAPGPSRGRGRPARSSDATTSPGRSNFHRTRGSSRSTNGQPSLLEDLGLSVRQEMPHRRTLRSDLHGQSISGFKLLPGPMGGGLNVAVPTQSIERNPSLPRNSRTSPDSSRSRRRRTLGRSRAFIPPRLNPDIFDAEDSSEVEFFTANSYSDNESNTEPLGRRLDCNIFRPTSEPEVRLRCIDSINVGSSEDEISVVFSSGPRQSPRSRTSESRRRPRTLGRRYNRGSRRSSLPHSPGVSLSPDPVEQVRQVEEDERFARVLQAQFDAEETRPNSSPNPCLMNIREAISSDEDSVDVEEMRSPGAFRHLLPPGLGPSFISTERMMHMPRIHANASRHSFNPLINTRYRPRTGAELWQHQYQIQQNTGMGVPWLQFIAEDNSYEDFLGLVEMNGDVSRGLQKSQINRLPTRKFATFNGASSSSELPHKRAELNKECQVCLNDYVDGDVLRILPCFHEFHTPCIDPWLKINHTCPVCRVVVNLDE